MSLSDRQKRPFRRGRCPQRPAIPAAPPKRADEDIGPYGSTHGRIRRGGYQPPAVNLAGIVRADHIRPYTQPPSVRQKTPHPAIAAMPGALLNKG